MKGGGCYRPFLMDNWYIPLVKSLFLHLADIDAGPAGGIVKAVD
jgi:hypothetical protein